MSDDKQQVLWHQSGISSKGEPFVQLMLGEKVIGQFTPEHCRYHARAITEAAEAAEQDAFLWDFCHAELEADVQMCVQLLVSFRAWREAHGKKGPPSDAKEFMITDEHRKQAGL